MIIRKMPGSFAILLIFICIGFAQGQNNKLKPVGSISLEITSKYDSSINGFYDVLVNEKFPLLRGPILRVEQSHTGKIWQLSSLAVRDKNNAERAILKIMFVFAEERGRTKIIQKKIRLIQGQRKNFRIKYQNFEYGFIASYKSEN